MLSAFVTANRQEIIERCRARVSARMAPRATAFELEHGIPLFLDQLATSLRAKLESEAVTATATLHGADLLRMGFSIAQVVHDYGDACQAVTGVALDPAGASPTAHLSLLNTRL